MRDLYLGCTWIKYE